MHEHAINASLQHSTSASAGPNSIAAAAQAPSVHLGPITRLLLVVKRPPVHRAGLRLCYRVGAPESVTDDVSAACFDGLCARAQQGRCGTGVGCAQALCPS